MTLTEEQHNELLTSVEEMEAYVSYGWTALEDVFDSRLSRMKQILIEGYADEAIGG